MNEIGSRALGGRRRRVLHIAGWYPSRRNPVSGIFVREHVKATALFNDVAVLYSEGICNDVSSGLYEIEDTIEHGLRTLRLRYRKSPVPKTSYLLYLWTMFAAVQRLIREGWRPHVIHAHVYTAGVPAVIIGRYYGLPVVVTEHFSGFPLRVVQGIEKLKAKFAFELANLVCPVSEDLRRHIKAYGIRTRFCVVPNAVDTTLFSPGPKTGERGDSRQRLLLVALLDPKKGLPFLLRAISFLRERRADFFLDIVGDGPKRSEYEELACKLGLRDFVCFHGLKTKQEVAEFMRRANVFVLPSVWENLPCVIIEAMASGLPIVATEVGGIPEIVGDDVGVLVPPRDAQKLAEALSHVLDHLGNYSSDRIAERARALFSYEAVGAQISQIYSRMERTADP